MSIENKIEKEEKITVRKCLGCDYIEINQTRMTLYKLQRLLVEDCYQLSHGYLHKKCFLKDYPDKAHLWGK